MERIVLKNVAGASLVAGRSTPGATPRGVNSRLASGAAALKVGAMHSSRPPADILRRVKGISCLDGWSVAVFAGLCTLASLAFGDLVGATVGALVTLGGGIEVRGWLKLRRCDACGMRWLALSQLVVLGAIWAYAIAQLLNCNGARFQHQVIPQARAALASRGIDLDLLLAQAGVDSTNIVPFVRLLFVIFFGTVMLVTLLYQGGLYCLYRRYTAAVEEALKPPFINRTATP